MAENLSVNNLTWQIAHEEILNNQRRESFKSYIFIVELGSNTLLLMPLLVTVTF